MLAGLPGNERAFSQLTIAPLDPDDPANANRIGPDNPADFSVDPGLRAYQDTLDGRSTNRYFYRAACVDGAHNRGPLGLASPPVYLPNATPPRTPAITKVAAGERKITLIWASNREPDIAEYRVFRADSAEAARDLRLMTLVKGVAVDPEPAARPALVEWTDDPVPGLKNLWYRVVAVDQLDSDLRGGGGNLSQPSTAIRARAFDQMPPTPPALTTIEWVRVDTAGTVFPYSAPIPPHAERLPAVRLAWAAPAADLKLLVQVKSASDMGFGNASGWLPPGTNTFLHRTTRTFERLEYRLKVVSGAGNANIDFFPSTLTPPP